MSDTGASVPDRAGGLRPEPLDASRPVGAHPLRDTLLALADRCEAATGPDTRELLQKAFRAVYGEKPARVSGGSPEWLVWLARYNPFFSMLEAGAYLDAAMTLVPPGWPSVQIGTTDDGRGYAGVAVHDGFMMAEDPDEFWAGCDSVSTPALALCAAALRARAAMEDQ